MGDGTLSLYKGESQLETLSQMYMHLAHTIDNQVPAANSNYTYNVTRLWSCSIDPKISWSRSGWQFFPLKSFEQVRCQCMVWFPWLHII